MQMRASGGNMTVIRPAAAPDQAQAWQKVGKRPVVCPEFDRAAIVQLGCHVQLGMAQP